MLKLWRQVPNKYEWMISWWCRMSLIVQENLTYWDITWFLILVVQQPMINWSNLKQSQRGNLQWREYGKRASPYCKQIEKHIVKEPTSFLNQSNVYSKLHTELRQMNWKIFEILFWCFQSLNVNIKDDDQRWDMREEEWEWWRINKMSLFLYKTKWDFN